MIARCLGVMVFLLCLLSAVVYSISLILQKALGRVPHEGGQRYQPTSIPAQTVHAWLAQGLRDDPPNLPALQRIEILPGSRVLNEPARWQQHGAAKRAQTGE